MVGIESALGGLSLTGKSKMESQVYALLEQDAYTEAVQASAAETKASTSPLLTVYAAYAHYRLGQDKQCVQVLSTLATENSSLRRVAHHLRAQALYRLEATRQALDEYAQLAALQGEQAVNESDDVAINKLACQAQKTTSSLTSASLEAPSDAGGHELHFNYSLYADGNGQTEAALRHLELAQTALKELKLDAADEAYELGPILLQKAHLTGDVALNDQAKQLKTDTATQYIASLNFADYNGNPYALRKTFARQLKPAARLFSKQQRLVAFNKIVAADAAGVRINKAVENYCKKYASHSTDKRCAVLRQLVVKKMTLAGLEARTRDDQVALEDRAAAAVVAVSRLVGKQKGFARSLALLESLPLAQLPGLLALQCSLLDTVKGKQDEQAVEQIEKALAETSSDAIKQQFQAGLILRRLRLDREAQSDSIRELATSLLKTDQKNAVALAALSIVDPSTSQKVPLPDLSSVDVDALERNLPIKRTRDVDTDDKTARPRKAKKVKTEAQLQAEKSLDPERWLPKRDRSNYKPTKQEKARAKGAHQGGVVDERLGEARVPVLGEATAGKKNKKKGKSKK